MERTQFVFKHKVPVATYAGYKLQQLVHWLLSRYITMEEAFFQFGLFSMAILNIYFVYITSSLMTLWSLLKLLPREVTGHRVVPLLPGRASGFGCCW